MPQAPARRVHHREGFQEWRSGSGPSSVRPTFAIAILLISIAILATAAPASAQDRTQTRSMVISRGGIVAAESPLAAQAGAAILARGGNAVDAAVAANAAMGVVEPMMNGIGGDLFAIVYEAKSGKLYGLNASGWAPAGLSIEFLKSKGITEMPQSGILAVTVPGAVDGWSKLLARFGTKQFSEVLAPAIYYAREGFPVPEWDAAYWDDSVKLLQRDKNAAATFLPGGRAPRVGELFRNPDLARSLELIAAGGRDAYYRGSIAKSIAAYSAKIGGPMTAADLAEYSSEWVEPISTTYRGWTVYEIPPNGQGIATLEMLNILEGFSLAKYGHNSADALHAMIEAKKLAYADMYRYVGDPKFSEIPVEGLASKDYAAARAKLIDMAKANCNVPPGEPALPAKGDTTYLTVVDADGNMVSLIQSNYSAFGSGLVADGTGFAVATLAELALVLGRAQAPAAHHHSRLHDQRPRTHRVWHHGRIQSGPGPRAICFERGRFWPEYSGGDGGGAFHQAHLRRLRRRYGRPHSRGGAR